MIKIFTRNSIDTTDKYNYGEHMNSVFKSALKDMETCILDGEFMAWDANSQRFEPFGGNRGIALDSDPEQPKHLCYMVFDIVYVDGQTLLGMSLEKRRMVLEKRLITVERRCELVPHITQAKTTQDIMNELDQKLLDGHEGLIIKNLNSRYELGSRNENMWVKLKPDYVQGLGDNLDLIVLGGYFGKGRRRAGRISHFLLGVKGQDGLSQSEQKFYTFCKVGSGYSLEQLQELNNRLHWMPYDKKKPPEWLMGWKPSKDDMPDMIVHPQNSVVVELKCYQVVECRKFFAGLTARFPRVEKIRDDKVRLAIFIHSDLCVSMSLMFDCGRANLCV